MANHMDGSDSEVVTEASFADAPLTEAQQNDLLARLRTAWAALPANTQAKLQPMLDAADGEFKNYLATGVLPHRKLRPVLRMKPLLTGAWRGDLYQLPRPTSAAAIEVAVGPGGEILGTGKFEEFDPSWELVTGTVWLENLLHKHPFPAGSPTPVQIPDTATIAMVSDFGTGNFGTGESPSTKIAKFIPSLEPHITIHLGDVYYAGISVEESSRLIDVWPRGSFGSFALNSNHEMYSGGGPYFNQAVGGPVFSTHQAPWSFFALENTNWIIVGLDSAYNADVLALYLDGSLGSGNAQMAFLKQMAQKATQENKKVIVLTHHNPLPENGVQAQPPLQLFTQVSEAFEGVNPPAYWYWGHVHAGIAYTPLSDLGGLRCRCIGYGALPWGLASELENNSNVERFENRIANDPADPLRVLNGFVVLRLDGAEIAETFYDENGGVAWKA